MGPNCSICANPKRKEIDKTLVAPKPNLCGIARTFGVSDDALRRHIRKGHVIAKIAKAANAQEALDADDLLKQLQTIKKNQREIREEARKRKKDNKPDPDNRLALEAMRDESRVIELECRIQGSFKDPKHPGDTKTQIIKTIIEMPGNGRGPKPSEGA